LRAVGPYRVGPLLGRGGMSEVYEARDEQGRAVALKLVRPGEGDYGARLVQEARVLAGLSHPGLVRLLDAGTVGDRGFLVMELVRGPTLAELAADTRMPPVEVAELGAQVADALAYVHARGVVHRDLKPSNILVGEDRRARIADFGVSRLLDASTITVAGTTLGTVAYMAPEQLEGRRVGPPADVWSLGLVLLECLLGQRVYAGSPAEVVARRLAGPVPLPADLPVPWRLVLEGMLDHRADSRLDAQQVAALLAAAPFGEPWAPGAAGSTVGHDLTALAPEATATAILAPDAARHAVARRRPRPAVGPALVVAVAAIVAALLGAGAVVLARDLHATGAGNRGAATTTAPTTTTVPLGQGALASLAGDLASAQANGAIDPALASHVDGEAQQAAADARAGNAAGAAPLLQQASAALARGARDGAVDPDTATNLQHDLTALAGALGVAATSGAPPAPTPTTAGGHGKPKAGGGDGG
jgi:hypothetical protein